MRAMLPTREHAATVTVAAAHLPGILHELVLELVAEDDLTDRTSHVAHVAALIEQIAHHVYGQVTLSATPLVLEEVFAQSLEHARSGLDEHEAPIAWPRPLRAAEVYRGAALGAQSALTQLAERHTEGRGARARPGPRHCAREVPGASEGRLLVSVEKVARKAGTSYRVRWREGGRNRARTFDTRRDAQRWDLEVRRRAQLGTLHLLDAGTETLDEYVTATWAPTYGSTLAPRTRRNYARLYDAHVAPTIGSTPLQALTAEQIGRWQSDRLAQGAGPVAVRRSLELLGSILQRAHEAGRIPANPARAVRKARLPRREEVRPIAPAAVERMREYLLAGGSGHPHRDAALISVLAYSGLRPGEALGLKWGDVGESTLLVQRSIALGEESPTKTGRAPLSAAPGPPEDGSGGLAPRVGETASHGARLPRPDRRPVGRDGLPGVEATGVRKGREGRGTRAGASVRAAPLVRFAAPARAPERGVRRQATRARPAAHPQHLRARGRRPGRRARDGRRAGDPPRAGRS